ncbi:MAG: V4R domain-containing protein [Armatimonadota bacterium]
MSIKPLFRFSWELLGDLETGRPHLGPTMRVEPYRLMLFSLRDVIEKRLDAEEAARIFYEAGTVAGWEFAAHLLADCPSLASFVNRLKTVCREMGIGFVEIEKMDPDDEIILNVTEDLDCSGLPDLGMPVCQYDEGFIAALLEYATEQKYTVREVDCWADGAHQCRFVARKITAG